MNTRMVWLTAALSLVGFFSNSVPAAPPGGDGKLELVVQKGHSNSLTSVNYSPDGKWIVTAAWDNSAIIWDVATGDQLRTLAGHTSGVRSACFSPDGKRIVTASADQTAIVWEAATGKILLTFKGHKRDLTSAIFSGDGKRIVTASQDKTAIVWDSLTGESLVILEGHEWYVETAGFSPDGKRVVTGSGDNSARIWDAETGDELLRIKHKYPVKSAGFSPDGKRIITAWLDEKAFVWDAVTGKQISTLDDAAEKCVYSACFHPDPTKAVTRNPKATVIWNLTTGKKSLTLPDDDPAKDHNSEVVPGVSPDGRQVAVADAFKVTIWNAESGEKIRVLGGNMGRLFFTTLPGDERRLLYAGEGVAVVWDMVAGERLRVIGRPHRIDRIHARPDGKRMVSTSNDNQAIVWDVETGRVLHMLKSQDQKVSEAAYSPDGKTIVTAFNDKTATIWDAESGTILSRLGGDSGQVEQPIFSPNGKLVISSQFKSVILWEAATGKQLHTWSGLFSSATFSPDSKRIIASVYEKNSKPIILLDAESGEIVRSVELPRKYGDLKGISPDGNSILIADGPDGFILNPGAPEKFLTLKGHTGNLWQGKYSPDGKRIVTASDDGTAIIWDAVTGIKLRTLEGHTSTVRSATFSRDGKRIVTTGGDGTTRFWNAETGLELGALVTLNDGQEWVIITPDGYFDGSANGARFIGLRSAGTNNLVPLDRYRKEFERPGLLGKMWAGSDYRGAKPVARDLPPKVRVVSPVANAESKDGKLTVEAEAESQGEYPVHQFRLLVNGRPHTARFGLVDVAEPKPGKATAKWEIELEPGRHTIEVIATTKAVFGKSAAVEVKYVGGDAGGVELPTLYILAVGVSKYEKQPLDFAHRDAEEVAKAFQTHSKALFKKIETKVLTDETATRANVMKGLAWLRKNMTQRDFGVFFFAGHGVPDARGKVYFLPTDGDREELSSTAIDGAALNDELTSTVGQLLVILDACHAGGVGDGKSRGLADELLKDLSSEEKGIAIMCSAMRKEEAGESREHRHGKFTVALLEGLKGQGDGKDNKVRLANGAVYFKQLDSYVTDRVKVLSKGEQHPVTHTPRGFRDFPLSKP